MPHEEMNEKQVAAYLHVDLKEVRKLASRGQVPCRKIRGEFRFRKGDVDHWVATQIPKLDKNRLAKIEKGVSKHHGFDAGELLICPMIPDGGIAVPLQAKTSGSVIRSLVQLADDCELVYSREDLLKEVLNREEMCSTAMMPRIALPHPRHPVPYDIAEGFVAVGVTSSGVPFGAEDGSLTRMFFLICCKDERTHLHVLARLAQILHNDETVAGLIDSEDEQEFRQILLAAEKAVISGK